MTRAQHETWKRHGRLYQPPLAGSTPAPRRVEARAGASNVRTLRGRPRAISQRSRQPRRCTLARPVHSNSPARIDATDALEREFRDEHLVARIREGDEAAWKALAGRAAAAVTSYLERMGHPRDAAVGFVQRALVPAFVRASEDNASRFRPNLVMGARALAEGALRLPYAGDFTGSLPEEQREVLLLKDLGLSFRDVGEILGLEEAIVRTRLRHALERVHRLDAVERSATDRVSLEGLDDEEEAG